eukprot:m.19887 g.19887  ORF g.19887 m.19887 type:complete len:324 (-) comp5498_c0_seq1:147-1118(-)
MAAPRIHVSRTSRRSASTATIAHSTPEPADASPASTSAQAYSNSAVEPSLRNVSHVLSVCRYRCGVLAATWAARGTFPSAMAAAYSSSHCTSVVAHSSIRFLTAEGSANPARQASTARPAASSSCSTRAISPRLSLTADGDPHVRATSVAPFRRAATRLSSAWTRAASVAPSRPSFAMRRVAVWRGVTWYSTRDAAAAAAASARALSRTSPPARHHLWRASSTLVAASSVATRLSSCAISPRSSCFVRWSARIRCPILLFDATDAIWISYSRLILSSNGAAPGALWQSRSSAAAAALSRSSGVRPAARRSLSSCCRCSTMVAK